MFRRFLGMRFLVVVIVALVALFMVACGEGGDEAKSTAVTVRPTATAVSELVESIEQQPVETVVAVVTQNPAPTPTPTATAAPAPVETSEPVWHLMSHDLRMLMELLIQQT